MPSWLVAFLASTVVAVAITPPLRELALITGFVDHPDRRKVHRDPVPYLGGVALMVAVLVALMLQLRLTPQVAVIVGLAAGLGVVGLLDDHKTVDPRLRLLAEFTAAGVTAAMGVRVHATGSEPVDLALTLLWIVGISNATNLMDNMDGLAGGVAAAAAISAFVLAVLGGQPVVATMAAATTGACLGFLAYNRPPASIFMGDAGSLFLGFLLAVLAVEVDPILSPPVSFLVPLLLLALPVLDTATVTLARLRHGLPVLQGGRDHLSHRLVARGFSAKAAVGVLVATEAALGALAVLAGRRVLPLGATLLLAALVLGGVARLAVPVRVYVADVVGLPRRLRLAALGVVVAMPILAAPAVTGMASADRAAHRGIELVRAAVASLRTIERDDPAATFQRAADAFGEARRALSRPGSAIGLAVPGLSSNLEAARTIVSVGERLSQTGVRVAALARAPSLRVRGGTLGLDEARRLEAELVVAERDLDDATRQLSAVDRGFLIPSLSRSVREVASEVDRQRTSVRRGIDVTRLARAMLGSEGPRRFFLGFRNSRELTGTDGLVGTWAELVADGGRLRVERFGDVAQLSAAVSGSGPLQLPADQAARWPGFEASLEWYQRAVSPDFPTTAHVVSLLYERSGGSPVDGVIAVDTPALADLLELTGPVTVASWPAPVGPWNVLDVMGSSANESGQATSRAGEVVEQVTRALATADLGSAVEVAAVLSRAAEQGHLRVYLADGDDQAEVSSLAAAGQVPPPSDGDSLLVVNHEAGGDDMAASLRRRVEYDVTLDPRRTPARLSGTLELSLEHVTEGTARHVREDRSYVSLYGPFLGDTIVVDGQPIQTVRQREFGRAVRSGVVTVPDPGVRTLSVNVDGKVHLSPEGWYRLDLLRQPTSVADEVDVAIAVPKGWRIAESRGVDAVARRTAHATLQATRPHTIWVRLERDGLAGLWDRFFSRG